jgi:AraC-like DNA-binding protein
VERPLVDRETLVWLELAREFLRAEADSGPVLLEQAAAVACMSPFHFHRLFARAYGETPHRFVTRQRIDRAKALLAATDLTVLEVCLEVGYQSVGTFSRRFSELVGRTPSDYRRSIRPVLIAVPRKTSIWTPRFVPLCFTQGWARAA